MSIPLPNGAKWVVAGISPHTDEPIWAISYLDQLPDWVTNQPKLSPAVHEQMDQFSNEAFRSDDWVMQSDAERIANRIVTDTIFELLQFVDRWSMWGWGDGEGGDLHEKVDRAAQELGLPTRADRTVRQDRKPLKKGLRKIVLERDAYRCRLCGGWENLSIDHIHPVKHGGTDDLDNLQTLCQSCNSKKGAKVADPA